MSARRKRNNRKRSRPSPGADCKDIAPPPKKQKISANTETQTQIQTPSTNISPKNTPNNNNINIGNKSQTPPPAISSPLQPHDEEEKAEQTDHAIHLDTPTPKPSNTIPNTQPSQLNINNALGHVLTLKQSTFNKKHVINQLQKMSKKPGGIPTDLQRQLNEYYNRKKKIDKHIKKRVGEIYNSDIIRIPSPQCQPIIITNICCDTFKDDNDEFDTEESWNCNVFICCIFAIIFIVFICILNMQLWNGTNNNMYCDNDYNYNNDTNICIDCPMHAYCVNGIAKCKDKEYKFHPIKGCLPKDMYYLRINGEMLYTQIYDLLKHRRREYVNCDKNVRYQLSKDEIKIFFVLDKRNKGMNEMEINDAMDEVFGNILLEDKFGSEIVLNVSCNKYYADLAKWEVKATENCTKMNILLMARTYGVELSVSVVCIAGILVAWRQFSL